MHVYVESRREIVRWSPCRRRKVVARVVGNGKGGGDEVLLPREEKETVVMSRLGKGRKGLSLWARLAASFPANPVCFLVGFEDTFVLLNTEPDNSIAY